jgi:ABC-type lipoprotein release transport system permease subunit
MGTVSGRYALRSVGRNARRTLLSVAGIGVGCALALFMESVNRGREELVARMGAYSGAGHLRVVPAGWRARRDPRLRLADAPAALRAARALPEAEAVTVRARAQALLAMGTHVVAVEMVGVEPSLEPDVYRFARKVDPGRYLLPAETGAVVVGKAIADRLHAGTGDEILATAVGPGGRIESSMLRIVGLVSTGSEEIDAGLCHVPIADVERLTGLHGPGEVTLVLRDWRSTSASRDRLAAGLAAGDEALTWGEITPELEGHIAQDNATSRFVSGVILLIVFLGVASAQLAAVLERRREFAVLAALGMTTGRMVRLLLEEAVAVGLAGAALGLALGLPLLWRFERVGLDFRKYMGSSSSFQGVVIEPVIYGDLGPWVLPYVLVVAVGATVVASLYPALFVARTDPAVALRVAQ